jgi:hypothetical protein
MKYFLTFFFILFSLSCSSPEPNPELKDQIYLDIQNKLSEVDKAIAAANLSIHDEEKNLTTLDIQSQQRTPIKRKIEGIRGDIRRFEQEKSFLIVRLNTRKKEVRTNSLKKFYQSPSDSTITAEDSEISDYSTINKMRSKPRQLSQKNRIKEYTEQKNSKAQPSKH